MVHIRLLAYPNSSMSGISGTIGAFAVANLWCQPGREVNEKCAPFFLGDNEF